MGDPVETERVETETEYAEVGMCKRSPGDNISSYRLIGISPKEGWEIKNVDDEGDMVLIIIGKR